MSNFIEDYMFYNSSNEVPPPYTLWGALSALSAIIGRKVWIDFEYFQIYPNLYVILLGEPGNRKTTAMYIAKGLIRELMDIPFSADCQTKESITGEMVNYVRSVDLPGADKPLIYTPISMFITELSQFIEVDPARMIDFLTTVYDAPFYDRKTRNKGQDIIVGPYVTLLGCTTPSWITSYLRQDIISGGFSRRCLFVLEFQDDDKGRRRPFPKIEAPQHEAWARCLQSAQKLMKVAGEFKWDPACKAFYSDWYIKRNISRDIYIRAFDSTIWVQILKVAMLMKLASNPDKPELILTLDVLKAAMELLQRLMVNLPRVFSGIGRNELNRCAIQALDIVRLAQFEEFSGIIPEKQLKSELFPIMQSREIQEVLFYLTQSGALKQFKIGERIFMALPEALDKLIKTKKEAQTNV